MQIRSRALAEQDPPCEQSPPQEVTLLTHEQVPLNGEIPPPHRQSSPAAPGRAPPPEAPPQEPMIQLTQETLLALIRDRQEEVNNKISKHEVAQTQGYNLHNRESSVRPPPKGVEDSYLSLAACLKVSNLSEYDGTGDPQEHLDKFYAKIDWYDMSNAAYCKVFGIMLSKRALAWFNQLPAGTISSLEQLYYPTEPATGKIQEVHSRQASSTMEDLLVRSQKYIRIKESNSLDPSFSGNRKGQEEEKERKHVSPARGGQTGRVHRVLTRPDRIR
ncbi:UNVERIFIED_CONTAM: hypothetical protein Sindi_2836500, partial [Sesamum indicum]